MFTELKYILVRFGVADHYIMGTTGTTLPFYISLWNAFNNQDVSFTETLECTKYITGITVKSLYSGHPWGRCGLNWRIAVIEGRAIYLITMGVLKGLNK